jgi:hypothetical protein
MDAVKTTRDLVVNVCEAHPGDFCWSGYITIEELERLEEGFSYFISDHWAGGDPGDYNTRSNLRELIDAVKARG